MEIKYQECAKQAVALRRRDIKTGEAFRHAPESPWSVKTGYKAHSGAIMMSDRRAYRLDGTAGNDYWTPAEMEDFPVERLEGVFCVSRIVTTREAT